MGGYGRLRWAWVGSLVVALLDLVGRSFVLLNALHDGNDFLLGLHDLDFVGQHHLRAHLALGVVGHHDLDLDTNHALTHRDVPDSLVNVVLLGLTSGDEVALTEFHGLGTLGSHLAADDDLATLGSVLHNESHDAIHGASGREASQELVAKGLALGHCATGPVLDALREELDGVFGEAVSLLHERRQLADATALLAEDLAGSSGPDDDLSSDRSDAHLDAGIAVLGQSSLQELVQLGVEDAVGDELALLGDLNLVGHGYGWGIQRSLEGD
mmetsp:Transcript_57291/g.125471  ORF Transcript_57291/g.125471 Transcript_57291/m.125471 type:complete len:270 (+) Transcript_57291:113-922(+)